MSCDLRRFEMLWDFNLWFDSWKIHEWWFSIVKKNEKRRFIDEMILLPWSSFSFHGAFEYLQLATRPCFCQPSLRKPWLNQHTAKWWRQFYVIWDNRLILTVTINFSPPPLCSNESELENWQQRKKVFRSLQCFVVCCFVSGDSSVMGDYISLVISCEWLVWRRHSLRTSMEHSLIQCRFWTMSSLIKTMYSFKIEC